MLGVNDVVSARGSRRAEPGRITHHAETSDELKTGADFRPHEVEEMARRVWARHLKLRKRQL